MGSAFPRPSSFRRTDVDRSWHDAGVHRVFALSLILTFGCDDAPADKGGDEKINKCVVKALKKARIKDSGQCTSKLLIGGASTLVTVQV